ncbi:ComE operon protein 1 [Clavibacter michiganensis subsp. michiganensis]|uniref:helix-hairpin-helix domain-containing protein n=1 Tax=Clavibacter michiganensis TaxID=28447 RepID=UPI000B757F4E|nr:helix-hairpin-helix domain-containing protein [Clavibacter michiganensis]OUE06611.1 ComE operon protein 1 [Clavibacter michiganensis subsp. michiganensis]
MRPLRRPLPGPDAAEPRGRTGWTDDGWEPDAEWPSDAAPPPRADGGADPADDDVSVRSAPDEVHPLPGRRVRIRLRVGIGAAVVLVGAALVVTILVTAVQSAGVASPAVAPATHPSPSAHTGAGAGASDGSGDGDTAAGDTGDASDADGGTGGSADGARTPIYVHVVGAVVSPGLYPLAPGSRVVDALAAAHGFADGADTAGVNLARVLSDGEQLVVPRQGEAPAVPATSGAPGAAGGAASPSAPVDLNTATAEQLETLPRVGPSLAARIIAWRAAHGRFARVADLGRVPGIGDRTLASLTPLVRV